MIISLRYLGFHPFSRVSTFPLEGTQKDAICCRKIPRNSIVWFTTTTVTFSTWVRFKKASWAALIWPEWNKGKVFHSRRLQFFVCVTFAFFSFTTVIISFLCNCCKYFTIFKCIRILKDHDYGSLRILRRLWSFHPRKIIHKSFTLGWMGSESGKSQQGKQQTDSKYSWGRRSVWVLNENLIILRVSLPLFSTLSRML